MSKLKQLLLVLALVLVSHGAFASALSNTNGAGATSGTVGAGTAGQVAYYPASSNSISSTPLITIGTNVVNVAPSNTVVLGTVTTGVWNGTAIPITNGGTGSTTRQAAINALTGLQSSGTYLRSDGTNATLSSLQSADIIAAFTGCSGTQYLGADGACHTGSGGSGTVTTTGTPATGNLTKFSGSTSITNGDLSGDCTTSGTLATTCLKTNGTSFTSLATTTPGTGVVTALGNNVGSAGAFVVFNGALGTPSSGTATNLTGTATGLTAGTATNLAGGALGSIPYQSAANTTLFLAGTISAQPNFVTSTGTGTVTQAPTLTSSSGSGNVCLTTNCVMTTPNLGTPSALVGTNITGTASGLTAGNVTTNANLTGPITSSGNATSIASQTGTGTKFVVDTSPTIVTPSVTTSITINAGSIITDTTTGLKIGTSTSQKLGFYNTAPIVQPTGNICTAMQNLGLVASCTESGAVTSVSNSDSTLTISPTTGAVVASLNLAHTNTWTKSQAVTPTAGGTQSAGGTLTPDFSASNSITATFGAGNLTIANPTNVVAGQTYQIALTQDGTGGRTVSWGTNFKWTGAAAPTLSTTPNAKDVISCWADTTTTLECVLALSANGNVGGVPVYAVGSNIASASTIAPVNYIQHVTGTSAIATITPPTGFSSTQGGTIILIADAAWTTTTAGNIFATMTASAGTQYIATYDGSKWYIK